MTNNELKLAKELCERATPGPWHTVDRIWLAPGDATFVIAGHYDPHVGKAVCEPLEVLEWAEGDEPSTTQDDVNMEFIAESRELMPKLIAEVERLVRQIADLKDNRGPGWNG